VANKLRPLRAIWHHNDGIFSLSCGEDDHPDFSDFWVPLCRQCTVSKMPEFRLFADLPKAHMAWQEPVADGLWHSEPFEEQENT
jgi:hypothetical protein